MTSFKSGTSVLRLRFIKTARHTKPAVNGISVMMLKRPKLSATVIPSINKQNPTP